MIASPNSQINSLKGTDLNASPERNKSGIILVGIVICLLLLSPVLFLTPLGQRTMLLTAVLAILLPLLLFQPRTGILAVFTFVVVLGGVRRWLIPLIGYTGNDPLLLVEPLLVGFCFLNLMVGRKIVLETKISKLVAGLLGIMALEVFNPLQGGLGVGIGGLFFYVVPVLWYFVGYSVGSKSLVETILKLVVGMALLAALYGLYQTFFGFSESEMEWVHAASYGALFIDGQPRAFSFFTSAQEYIALVSIAWMICWAFIFRKSSIFLAFLPIFLVATVLESSRGPIITLFCSAAIAWAVQGKRKKTWLPRVGFAVIVAFCAMFFSLSQAQNAQFGAQQGLIQHDADGILHVTDNKKSTASLHSLMVVNGLNMGIANPIGYGLGSTTIASRKFKDADSSGVSAGTEIDVSNMFVSIGLLGGILYLVLIGTVISTSLRFWVSSRSLASLGIFLTLMCTLGSWELANEYSITMLVWLLIGCLDKMQKKQASEMEVQPEPEPLPELVPAMTP